MMLNKALFLDRDGVVNIERNYVIRPEDFRFQDGFFELCRYFQNKSYKIIIITNQSGIERNYFTESELQKLHKFMIAKLQQEKITITDIFYCTSLDDGHLDRKPNTGMFIKARDKHFIDMASSVSIGDRERDIIAAKNAGVGVNILLLNDTVTTSAAEYSVKNLHEIPVLINE
jgi:D,D-heptose 1,7-bisphosphate phosphatase